MTEAQPYVKRRKKGFERTASLLQRRIQEASESRGFSQSKLLTHWEESVGPEIATMSRPVKVSYAKGGFGATLTLLTTGAYAPMLQAELPKIRNRVNAVYGHNAISHIRITQTAPMGFSEGRAVFEAPKNKAKPQVTPEAQAQAKSLADGVHDKALRQALEKFAGTFLTRHSTTTKEN
ncbi:DciA family protein [uncultured Celeribacter sp.]|uniref:DUF721 domain-containing protein n=1 Tax=uncultured Celeribacter sp. TaxID=1303376 RepID=UPI002AA8CC34|nr:DciA family protein [uncultured Celeribacter sp.]